MTMNQGIRSFVKRIPLIANLANKLVKQGAYPAGHYYSPIPSRSEVRAYVESRMSPSSEILGIELNEQGQLSELEAYTKFYQELPFTENKVPERRYYYNNTWFSYSDAIFLFCFLRKQNPKKIIEVGSGFSSAVMLDTIDAFFPERPEVTFVEPYPDRLISLFRGDDRSRVNLIQKKIQDVPLDTLLSLDSGDLLFIDSSHVVKCGSDLQFLMFDILPRLKPGVFVHFHDVFYPFDYPSEWLLKGRYWNENYFLRAFLSYNSEWEICFFNTYAHFMFGELIKQKMPLCAKKHGGSLYIRRKS